MTQTLIGYARCSTERQDLSAQRKALQDLGVSPDYIYTDHGLTGTSRARPGLDQAFAAVRHGDTWSRRSWTASPDPCRMPAPLPTSSAPRA